MSDRSLRSEQIFVSIPLIPVGPSLSLITPMIYHSIRGRPNFNLKYPVLRMFVMFVLAANVAQKAQWSGCIRHFQRGGFVQWTLAAMLCTHGGTTQPHVRINGR